MRVQVKLFAGLREAAGTSSRELDLEAGATVEGALARLREELPALSGARFTVAINRSYATASTPLGEGDELALIPPVSGG